MPPEKEPRIPIKSLRTYQGDVEEAMSKNNYSASTILVAEQKRRIEAPPVPEIQKDNSGRNKLFIYVGSILFLLGIGAVGGVYYFKSSEKTQIEQKTKALLGFSLEKSFSIASSSREQFLTNIIREKDSFKMPVNSVLYLNLLGGNDKSADSPLLLSLLAPNMPPSLVRSFENEYMLGVYSFDTNEPFIILRTNDFALSYSGMLKWEKDIPKDLSILFSTPQNASSTSGAFVDEAIRNKDIRTLKDSSNKSLILYSFIDKKTLIITKNENLFNAILGKYLLSQQAK